MRRASRPAPAAPRRCELADARRLALLTLPALLLACGPAAVAAPPPPPPSPPVTVMPAAPARAFAGVWTWSHVSDEAGVRRVERERWQLAHDGDAMSGFYLRRVSFLSSDGVPFRCNHALSYEQVTLYRVQGTASADGLQLEETRYETADSPCDDGYRRLGRYRGELLADGTLRLSWADGAQTLIRPAADDAATANGASEPPTLSVQPRPVTGAWRWTNRTAAATAGEIRVEAEAWALAEAPSGAISGTMLRTVTVFDEAGRRYACSGDTFYRYRDRYTVRGARTGAQLTLTEIAVDPEQHPCLVRKQRHLDAAVGTARGAYLVLIWRGDRRQVLHRVDAAQPTESAGDRAETETE